MAKQVQVFRNPDSRQQLAKASRQQALAQALMQSANPSNTLAQWNQMPVVPKYGIAHGLADVGKAFLANKMAKKSDDTIIGVEQAEESARKKAMQDWAKGLMGHGSQMPPVIDESGATGAPPIQVGGQPPRPKSHAEMLAFVMQGIEAGVPQPVIEAQLKTLEPFTLGDTRYQGNQPVVSNEKPLDEVSKLEADFKAGRIGESDYNARKTLLTTRAPGVSVNVNTEGQYDKEFAKSLAGHDANQINEYRKLAESGRNMIKTIDDLERRNPNVLAGGGAETRADIANWLSGWTGVDVVDPEVLKDTQAFNAQTSKMILDSLGGSLGAGVSNADVQFIRNTVPKLEYSREARQELMDFLRKRASDNIDVYNRAREYGEAHGGLKGFESFPVDPKTKRGQPTLKANPDGSYTYQQ